MNNHENQNSETESKFPVTRETLYSQVWSQPMTALADEYGVSSSYLARVCTRLNVPRPERGYWAKLAAGKPVQQPALPEARPGDEPEWSKDGGYARYQKPCPTLPKDIKREFISKKNQPKHHQLIRNVKGLFLIGKETEDGYLKPNKKLLVDIVVSKAGIDKALDIMNHVILAFDNYDCRVCLAPNHEQFSRHYVEEREKPNKRNRFHSLWSPGRPTVVYMGTVAIGLTLFESSEEVEVTYVDGEYIPTTELKAKKLNRYKLAHSWTTTKDKPSGRFCLQAYSPYHGTSWLHQWEVPLKQSLKTFSEQIVKELQQYACTIADLVKDANHRAELEEKRWQEMQEKWRQEEKEKQRAKAQEDSANELFEIIEAWTKTKSIESFFQEVEAATLDIPVEEQAVVHERLKKARELIGNTNALDKIK